MSVTSDRGRSVDELRARLEEAEETLRAIRSGEVDALVIATPHGDQVFTLQGADRPYRIMVEEMSEGAATLSEAGLVLYANRRLAELLRTPLQRLIGAPLSGFVEPAERPRVQVFLDGAQDAQRHGEVAMRAADATSVPAHVAASPLNLDGESAVCLVVTDLSETKRAEAALADAHAHLRHHAGELERVNRDLTRSNEELASFAYVASHDLSAPLRNVAGFAGLLAERYRGALDAEADEFLDFIVTGVTRMQTLLDDLLAYSRVDAQARPFEPVDLNDLVRQVLGNLQSAIREQSADVTVDPLPTVVADAGQLGQVFQNLVANALLYVPAGVAPAVRVTSQRRERDGAWQVIVADNGIGVDPRFREQIFDVFKRLHPPDRYPGSGIGLAICKKIVERHGGHIWVETAGSGSLFCFTIPDHPEPRP
ncbi:MAG TPA: ATP-binding protein [Mycobacteriales bacterium]|nr:ATP-binding protein [Mycobacteriales bacterium]